MCVCVCIYICMYIYICHIYVICIYICVYIYIHIHIKYTFSMWSMRWPLEVGTDEIAVSILHENHYLSDILEGKLYSDPIKRFLFRDTFNRRQ